jgi:hypothetical protein
VGKAPGRPLVSIAFTWFLIEKEAHGPDKSLYQDLVRFSALPSGGKRMVSGSVSRPTAAIPRYRGVNSP